MAGSSRNDPEARLTAPTHAALHAIYQRAYYVPVILAAYWFGAGGALRPGETVRRQAVYSAISLYAWPGNIRELENVIERALVLDRDGVLGTDDLPERLTARGRRIGNLRIELPDEGISWRTSSANCCWRLSRSTTGTDR